MILVVVVDELSGNCVNETHKSQALFLECHIEHLPRFSPKITGHPPWKVWTSATPEVNVSYHNIADPAFGAMWAPAWANAVPPPFSGSVTYTQE